MLLSPRTMSIISPTMSAPSQWSKLSPKQKKWAIIVGVIAVLAVIGQIGQSLESDETPEARTAGTTAPGAPAAVPQPAVTARPAKDALCLLVPPTVPGFQLIDLEHPWLARKSLGADATPRCSQVTYWSADGVELKLTLKKTNEELDAPGGGMKAVKVGKHAAVQVVDTQVGTLWRSGAWLFTAWLVPKKPATERDARRLAPAATAAIAEWADDALAGLDDDAGVARIKALEDAVKSQAAADSKVAHELRRVGRPAWATSVAARGDELEVIVRTDWLLLPKNVRTKNAKALWNNWARIHSPERLDSSHLRLVDSSGERVGGSGMNGSSISMN